MVLFCARNSDASTVKSGDLGDRGWVSLTGKVCVCVRTRQVGLPLGKQLPQGESSQMEAGPDTCARARQHTGEYRENATEGGGSEEGIHPRLLGPNGKPIVKLFVFAPRDAYEFICQDTETK